MAVYHHTEGRIQVGTRVVFIHEKAAAFSQPRHRKREARQKLNNWATASPAQQGAGETRRTCPGHTRLGQDDAVQHHPFTRGPRLKAVSSLHRLPPALRDARGLAGAWSGPGLGWRPPGVVARQGRVSGPRRPEESRVSSKTQ